MNEKIEILFIINPISGTGKQRVIEKLIESYLDLNRFQPVIQYTERAGHATDICKAAVDNNCSIVVAVGGDGSVNETGKSLIATSSALGIIPTGSGNGLARHLGIPMELKAAVELLNTASFQKVDTATMNNEVFLGTAGIGFDAHIGKKFDEAPSRGFSTYFKLTLKELFSYQPDQYEIKIDDQIYHRKAFLICFANSNQWGNNVFISPDSELNDGWLRIIVIKRIPILFAPLFALKLFRKTVNSSKYFEEFKGKEIRVKQTQKIAHLDGDPFDSGKEVLVKIQPQSLTVFH